MDPCIATSVLAPQPAGELVVALRSGLGNRLRGLLSVRVRGEHEGVPVRFVWHPSLEEGLPCRFEDLFALEAGCTLRIETGEPAQLARWPIVGLLPPGLDRAIREGRTLGIAVRSVVYHPELTAWRIVAGMRKRFARLRPAPSVLARISAPASRFIAVHVRFSDHLPAYCTTPRWVYPQASAALLASTQQRIGLCGDDPTFLAELQRTDPSRIEGSEALGERKAPDRSKRDGNATALADLLTLTRAALVAGAPQNTFSGIGGILGGGSGWALTVHPLLGRAAVTQSLWKLYAWSAPNQNGDRFNPFRAAARAVARAVATVARFLRSSPYQDWAWPLARKAVARNLRAKRATLRPVPLMAPG